MSLNLAVVLREGAKKFPEKRALIVDGAAFSYAQLHRRAQQLAGSLLKLGVRRGEHVALMLPNVAEFTVAYFACHYVGAAVVPINVLLMPDEIAYHLDDSDAVALIAWRDVLDRAKAGFERAQSCRELIVAGSNSAGAHAMSELEDAGAPVQELPATDASDTAVILYTSGTTGRPKGAELTHFNMFYNADSASRAHGIDDSTTALAVLPLFHSFGQTVIQNATMMRGGTVVLLPRFEAQAAYDAIERHNVTFFAGVPTMYFALLNHPAADRHDLASLKMCVSGGAPMPVEVMRSFMSKCKSEMMEGYGLSETSPLASCHNLAKSGKPGSVGTPIWGVEFRLVDDADRVVEESGVAGEICIKGHNIMKGYYKRPEATAEAVRDGWFKTGDIATRDDDGYYFIVDRKKDMILRGGYNVYPREVEEVLYAHDAIAEAAVIGLAHQSLGEEVCAIVALKPGKNLAAEELTAFCKERLAAYKYPRVIEFLAELPKGPTGKILKRELRATRSS